MTLLEAIVSRCSVHPKRLTDPGPDWSAIQVIVGSAATATDHCGLRPWRCIAIVGEAREYLGDLFVSIKSSREPGAPVALLERERRKAQSVPVTIVIVTKIMNNHPVVPTSEQYAAVGAAIQNMLLCTHALGFAAKMLSGDKVKDRRLARALDLRTNERVFGFLCIGTGTPGQSIKHRSVVDETLTKWDPITPFQFTFQDGNRVDI